MRTALLLAALVAATGTTAADAGPRKPLTGTYDVSIPVPYPMEGPSAHCTEGYDNLTRNAKQMKLTDAGQLDVKVSGFVGDWVVEIFDAKGKVLATGAVNDPVGGSRSARYRKKRGGTETVTVTVCNFGGTPYGKVEWKYAFNR